MREAAALLHFASTQTHSAVALYPSMLLLPLSEICAASCSHLLTPWERASALWP